MASGGSGVRWFQRELAAGEALDVLDAEAAATPPGADGVVMLPYLLGEKTPVNDPLATRRVRRPARRPRPRAPLPRPARELRLRRAAPPRGARRARRAPARARVTNGGASSRLWKQIVADVTGLVLEPVVDHPGLGARRGLRGGRGQRRVRRLERDRALRGARRAGRAARRDGGRLRRALPRLPRALRSAQAGSVNVKQAPPPGASATRIVPPCSSTMARAMARPRPVPPAPRLSSPRQKRSKTRSSAPGRQARARVAHAHLDAVARADQHAAARRRVADGVADEVREHAAELQRVAAAAQAAAGTRARAAPAPLRASAA